MNVLAFERQAQIVAGRRVRRAVFERRSALPVSAACLVANSVRETLAAALNAPVALRLLEPVLPDPNAWRAIAADALMFNVRGPLADAAFVLRPSDALALAGAAFGEYSRETGSLSAVENEVLARALRAAAGSLAPVCGREISALERILDIRGFTTYFELLVEVPVAARIGIALSREPQPRACGGLRIDDLLDVEVEVEVEFARGSLAAQALLGLRPGAEVPMMTRVGDLGVLRLGGSVLARGECGVLGERNTFIVRATP